MTIFAKKGGQPISLVNFCRALMPIKNGILRSQRQSFNTNLRSSTWFFFTTVFNASMPMSKVEIGQILY